jgi:hypothetical protein
MTANTYKGSMDFMSDENFDKYSKTIEYYDKGVNEMQDIYSEMRDALETYDTQKINEVSNKMDPAMDLIKKAIEQLEFDRYK